MSSFNRPLSPLARLSLIALCGVLLIGFLYYSSQPLTYGQGLIEMKKTSFPVEIAKNHTQRKQGLMFRDTLEKGHGMLFVFPWSTKVSFWMKNTNMPLDILFFDKHHRFINGHYNVPPCVSESCPIYYSNADALYVVEVNAGEAQQLALKPGDLLSIKSAR